MIKCNNCGRIFENDELASWEESRGEFWGQKCTEKMIGCPYCFSGDYDQYCDGEEGEENDGGTN